MDTPSGSANLKRIGSEGGTHPKLIRHGEGGV